MSLFSAADPVALVTGLTGLATAVGVALKNWRDIRRERRARRRTEHTLERVTRAAARHSSSVADVVDDLERTGEFKRPTTPPDDRG